MDKELDLKIAGEISIKLSEIFPETIVAVKKAREFDAPVAEENMEHYIVKLEEPDIDIIGYDLTNIYEAFAGDIENTVLAISSFYGDDVPTTPSGRKALGELLEGDFNNFKDKLRVIVINEANAKALEDKVILKQIGETNLYKMLVLDIADFCKNQTLPSKKIMIVPKTLSNTWGITAWELMEIATENTGDHAYASDVSYEYDEPLSTEEMAVLSETLAEVNRAKAKQDSQEKEAEHLEEVGNGWDDYESEWDSPVQASKNDTELAFDSINLDIRVLELHAEHGAFGSSVIADGRYLIELCNKEKVDAAFILPYYDHKCLFIPDKGFDAQDLKISFKQDLQEMLESDSSIVPLGEDIYRFTFANGLKKV